MLTVLPAEKRGHSQQEWLNSHHTFSFADFYNPRQMGFRALRVLNDDTIDPGEGFDFHSHRDMEIISYVLAGALAHRDSMGSSSVIRAGDVQRMSAGSGVYHSEFNASETEPVHLLQIWILPEQKGIDPCYDQKSFSEAQRRGRLCLVASLDGRDGSISVNQDVSLYATLLSEGESVTHFIAPKRHAWIHVASGAVTVNGQLLRTGSGAAASDESAITLDAMEASEVLLFDLA